MPTPIMMSKIMNSREIAEDLLEQLTDDSHPEQCDLELISVLQSYLAVEAENKKQRDVLKYYADQKNYIRCPQESNFAYIDYMSLVELDHGQKARVALMVVK